MPESDNKRDSEQQYPVVDMVLNSIADWVNHYRDSTGQGIGLSRCDSAEVNQIANECGLSAAELRSLASKGPHSADLVTKMLLALGVDPKALAEKDPLVMRDLQRLCTTCGHKGQCAHDLADGTAKDHFHEYCPNSFTLDALFAGKDKTAAQ